MTSQGELSSLGETLIPIIDKLQQILHGAHLPDEWKIQLPEVAVVGSQSSGKSSVLESLVGRDFLPRGSGICTRRPLVLNLRRTETGEEYAEFPTHLPDRKFTDFEAVRDEIENETTRLLGNKDKDISDRPIHLTIYSPHVLTMSLIDLPGMTRIPVKGQPDDISSKLEALIMKYIQNPSCIILAVSAANTDLANSDAIALSRSVDPDGLRTIGVLTKLDIMDKGTDALAMLHNDVLPLRLGYTAVVNRSQYDIQEKTPVTKARENEAKFFAENHQYASVTAQCGIPALSKRYLGGFEGGLQQGLLCRIHTVLVKHIEEKLPKLREAVMSQELKARTELDSLGSAVSESNSEAMREALLRHLDLYSNAFNGRLNGRAKRRVAQDCMLQGGARIRHVFQQIFGKVLDDLDPCCGMTDEEIWATMNNCAGVSRDVMLSQDALEAIVNKTLEQLRNPGLQCLNMVTTELMRISDECTPPEISRFPALQDRISAVVRSFITAAEERAKTMLVSLFECETAYINTDHPDYIGMQRAWKEHMASKDGAENSGSESVSHDSRSHSPNRRTTVPLAHSRHHGSQQNGHDEGGLRPSEDDSGGWGLSRLWRRGEAGPSAGTDANGNTLDGFGSLVATNSITAVQPSRTRAVFLPSAPSELKIGIHNERDKDTVMVMRTVVASYFGIVRNTMKDLVPKVIMRFVVSHTAEMIHGHLIAKILSGDEKDVMRERADVAERRAELSVTCGVLAKALAQLQQIPRELETTGCSSGWPGGTQARLQGDSLSPIDIVRRSNADIYAGRPR